MKKVFLLLLISFFAGRTTAQTSISKTFRVAIFSPLWLDSVFNDKGYRYGKNFPKFAQQGLDFVQGAQIALDSMPLPAGTSVQAVIFDSKAFIETIPFLISAGRLDSADLIIGSFSNAEFVRLAAFAKQKNIPIVSATLPNDGAVTQNPFVVIQNSTLKTHCEAIYAGLLQNHSADNIVLVRRRGAQEDKIAAYFKEINEPDGKPLLSLKTVNFEENPDALKLDSTKRNVIVGASMHEDFTNSLVDFLYAKKKTRNIKLIGMPNWDGFPELKRSSLKDFPIWYSTAFTPEKNDAFCRYIQAIYHDEYKGTPSDITYRGYESVYFFTRILAMYPNEFTSRLNDPGFKVFSDYNFKPVFSESNRIPDYFENKKLWMMKIVNGKALRAE